MVSESIIPEDVLGATEQAGVSGPEHDVEKSSLLAALNDQREHAIGIMDDLDERASRQPLLASGWSCLGMIQHLALDVELFWFRAVVAGEPAAIADRRQATARAVRVIRHSGVRFVARLSLTPDLTIA
jgi:hypothetical protein